MSKVFTLRAKADNGDMPKGFVFQVVSSRMFPSREEVSEAAERAGIKRVLNRDKNNFDIL